MAVDHRDEPPPQGVHQPRQGPHIIRKFLALVPEGLNLGLCGRIGDREPGDFAVDIPERHRRLVCFDWITKIVEEIL